MTSCPLRKTGYGLLIIFLATLVHHGICRGNEVDKGDAAGPTSAPAGLTVAVLDFDASTPGNPDLGGQIGQVLTTTLSGEQGITLVDRATLTRTLQEHELTLTGLVNADQAIKVGKLSGARILITGKAFVLDRQLYITAKLIGTETSRVDGVLVIGDIDAEIGGILMKLSQKVAMRLRDAAPKLVAQEDVAPDPLPALKKALSTRTLPTISVHVMDRHVSATKDITADEAAATEIRKLFIDAGFKVVDGTEKVEAQAGVSIVINGEVVSEFSARIGTLFSCSASVNIKITDRKTGHVILSEQDISRGVDLSESMAGRSARQKAGNLLGIKILRHFDQTLPIMPKETGNPPIH